MIQRAVHRIAQAFQPAIFLLRFIKGNGQLIQLFQDAAVGAQTQAEPAFLDLRLLLLLPQLFHVSARFLFLWLRQRPQLLIDIVQHAFQTGAMRQGILMFLDERILQRLRGLQLFAQILQLPAQELHIMDMQSIQPLLQLFLAAVPCGAQPGAFLNERIQLLFLLLDRTRKCFSALFSLLAAHLRLLQLLLLCLQPLVLRIQLCLALRPRLHELIRRRLQLFTKRLLQCFCLCMQPSALTALLLHPSAQRIAGLTLCIQPFTRHFAVFSTCRIRMMQRTAHRAWLAFFKLAREDACLRIIELLLFLQ